MALSNLTLLLAALGHLVLWTAAVNRLHAIAIPRGLLHGATLACWLMLPTLPLVIASMYQWGAPLNDQPWPVLAYLVPSVGAAIYALFFYFDRVLNRHDRHPVLLGNETSTIDFVIRFGHRPISGRKTEWLTRIPGNQVLMLQLQQKTLYTPRLPLALDGLVIAQLSDLHMTGALTQRWLEEIISLTNQMRPDLVAITGDLLDHNRCLDWLPAFGKLRAPQGVYFVLGNHDARIDHKQARVRLTQAGLIDLGGTWKEIRLQQHSLIVAGNELPWFSPAADMTGCPVQRQGERLFRLLLSHSPDQLRWARAFDFDLMLAGHTHGGQIRLPIIGPVVAPSRAGVRYAAGTFYQAPTMLHVSRGLSSEFLLRMNCPPELSILTLRREIADAQPEVRAKLSLLPTAS